MEFVALKFSESLQETDNNYVTQETKLKYSSTVQK